LSVPGTLSCAGTITTTQAHMEDGRGRFHRHAAASAAAGQSSCRNDLARARAARHCRQSSLPNTSYGELAPATEDYFRRGARGGDKDKLPRRTERGAKDKTKIQTRLLHWS
jgi:hypothetical protein